MVINLDHRPISLQKALPLYTLPQEKVQTPPGPPSPPTEFSTRESALFNSSRSFYLFTFSKEKVQKPPEPNFEQMQWLNMFFQVRILRPGNPIPGDVRPFVNKHPEMSTKVCALIEFERTEFAMKAVRQLNDEQEEKMKVLTIDFFV